MPTIEQGGNSLYPSMAQRATSVEVLRILISIGPTETIHFQTWSDKAGNAPPLTDPTNGLVFPEPQLVAAMGLFIGQPAPFFELLCDLAAEADAARRELDRDEVSWQRAPSPRGGAHVVTIRRHYSTVAGTIQVSYAGRKAWRREARPEGDARDTHARDPLKQQQVQRTLTHGPLDAAETLRDPVHEVGRKVVDDDSLLREKSGELFDSVSRSPSRVLD
ncbi:MAG TPA: hypothetical protein VGH34_23860 [Vicinamibacterales bacterium]